MSSDNPTLRNVAHSQEDSYLHNLIKYTKELRLRHKLKHKLLAYKYTRAAWTMQYAFVYTLILNLSMNTVHELCSTPRSTPSDDISCPSASTKPEIVHKISLSSMPTPFMTTEARPYLVSSHKISIWITCSLSCFPSNVWSRYWL